MGDRILAEGNEAAEELQRSIQLLVGGALLLVLIIGLAGFAMSSRRRGGRPGGRAEAVVLEESGEEE